jgi:hypothetical protein
VTLKPPKSQSLLCRPQCEVDAGEGLAFFGCDGFEVGLEAMGETAVSEGFRFGCEGMCVDIVVIGVAFGSELGGERRALGDLDLDRECGWKMES